MTLLLLGFLNLVWMAGKLRINIQCDGKCPIFYTTWRRQGHNLSELGGNPVIKATSRRRFLVTEFLDFYFQNASSCWHTCAVRPHSFPRMWANLITSFFHAWKLLCNNPFNLCKARKKVTAGAILVPANIFPLLDFEDLLHVYKEQNKTLSLNSRCYSDQLRALNSSFPAPNRN